MDCSPLCGTTRAATNHIDQSIGDAVDNVGDVNEEIDDRENRHIENLGEYIETVIQCSHLLLIATTEPEIPVEKETFG